MTTYRVTLADGQTFLMSANLAEASAPIRVLFHPDEDGGEWQPTPYQTADARHDRTRAAELCAEYFADGEDDCTDPADVAAIGA